MKEETNRSVQALSHSHNVTFRKCCLWLSERMFTYGLWRQIFDRLRVLWKVRFDFNRIEYSTENNDGASASDQNCRIGHSNARFLGFLTFFHWIYSCCLADRNNWALFWHIFFPIVLVDFVVGLTSWSQARSPLFSPTLLSISLIWYPYQWIYSEKLKHSQKHEKKTTF